MAESQASEMLPALHAPRTYRSRVVQVLVAMLMVALAALAHANGSNDVCSTPDVWGGVALSDGVGGGMGTEDAPYLLTTPAHFLSVSDYYAHLANSARKPGGDAHACWGAHFSQQAHVDLANEPWTPIGVFSNRVEPEFEVHFFGTFDGNEYEIRNLSIAPNTYDASLVSTTDFGLFGRVTYATLRDIRLVDAAVDGGDGTATGGLIGRASYSTITNVHVAGSVSGANNTAGIAGLASSSSVVQGNQNTATIHGDRRVGGIVGNSSSTLFADNVNYGSVTGTSINVGGILGNADSRANMQRNTNMGLIIGSSSVAGTVGYAGAMSNLEDNLNRGTVSASDERAGGIAGKTDKSTFTNNRNEGRVQGVDAVGGIAGFMENPSTFSRNTNDGDVEGVSGVGGVVGTGVAQFRSNVNLGTVRGVENVGGIAGDSAASSFISNLNKGAVAGTTTVGGLVGTLLNGSVDRSANLAVLPVSGTDDVGGLVGKAEESQISESFSLAPVHAQGERAGGLVGGTERVGITDSSSMGMVSVTGPTLGASLLGDRDEDTYLDKAFASGGVTTDPESGSALYPWTEGRSRKPAITHAFWDVTTTGVADGDDEDPFNGVGLATPAMKTLATYERVGWSIAAPSSDAYASATWGLCEGITYPFLRWAWESADVRSYLSDNAASLPISIPSCLEEAAPDRGSGNLSSLLATHGTLEPAFQPARTRYTVILDASTGSTALFAVTEDPSASIRQPHPISVTLEPGQTTTRLLVVEAEDGTSTTYTITFTRAVADVTAPVVSRVIADDQSAWVYVDTAESTLNFEYKLNDGSWITPQPPVTTMPMFIPGLANDAPNTLHLRAVTPNGVSAPSTPLVVTATPPQPVPVSIAFETATAETVIATDGARRIATITIDATITNEGNGPLTHTWINPSLGTGAVTNVTTSDPTATLTKVAGRWYLANLALATGDSLMLTLTLVTEVQ